MSDESVLLEALREAGVPDTELSSVKEDKLLLSEIEKEEIEGRNMGVTGVPFYIFNEKYAVSGAQPSELFLEVFDRLQSEGV